MSMIIPKRIPIAVLALALLLTGSALAARGQAATSGIEGFERARVLRVLSLLQSHTGVSSVNGTAAKRLAVADEGGAITGVVHGLDLEGYESASVVAWQADSISSGGDPDPTRDEGVITEGSVAIARAKILQDGTYRLTGLMPGPYYVSGMARGYETRYYEDALDLTAATMVHVIEGETVEGVDFTLQRFNAGTGSIAGVVTDDADGRPIAGAVVHAFGADSPFSYGLVETDDSGAFTVPNLRSGDYLVEVLSQDYLPEFYGDVTVYEEAERVTVTEPEQTAGIDFALTTGGSISGTVRNEQGGPVAGAYVSALLPDMFGGAGMDGVPEGRLTPAAPGGWAITDEDGSYRMGGLATGEYRVQAQFSTRWQYVSVWFDGVSDWDQAAPVAVTVSQETSAIDMRLPLPLLQSSVSGRVTDSSGQPVAKAFVTLQAFIDGGRGDSLIIVDGSTGRETEAVSPPDVEFPIVPAVWAYATTDKDGRYVIDELPSGSYLLSAATESGWEYVQRWYVNADTPRDARPLVLGEAERLGDIDITLPLRLATASVAGSVRDQNGHPLAWAFVQISAPDEPLRIWAYAQTDEQGSFRVDRLPAGTYVLHASYNTGELFGQAWFEGAQSEAAATRLILTDGESRVGIDMQLHVRPLFGVVAGTVTDAASGLPIGRAYVELTPLDRDARLSAPIPYREVTGVTNDSGTFRLDWIPEGSYRLTVYASGAVQNSTQSDKSDISEVMMVAGGETTHRDIILTRRKDGEGVISGRVRLSHQDTGPLPGGEEPAIDMDSAAGDTNFDGVSIRPDVMQAFPQIAVVIALPATVADASVRYVAVTAPDGSYELRGLPSGDYAVMCFAPGHIGTYYGGEYAPDRAETVSIDGAGPVTDIDFELAGWYRYYDVAEATDTDESGDGARAPTNDLAAGGAEVVGNVTDAAGAPIEAATVYLLDTNEQPVAFAKTGSDGSFLLPAVTPGEYRVYASRLGLAGGYNGNQRTFAAADPLGLDGGQLEVNFVLSPETVTAVTEGAGVSGTTPMEMVLQRNYPNPFNPQTRIIFTVPVSGWATVRIHNALGQRVATLYRDVAAAGRQYEVVFQAHGLGTGTYYYDLEFAGRRLTRSMTLVK
jgi:protocatechuate 3,4-dioxygenase beta subunit